MIGQAASHIWLHVGPLSAGVDWWSLWSWEPSVLLGCAGLVAVYIWAVRKVLGRLTSRAWLYFSGVLVLLLSLISPVDTLGDSLLFSAHMLQHLLMELVVPPLLLTGVPVELWRRLLKWPYPAQMERILRQPLLAWVLGVGTLWVWHIPALYNEALQYESVHIFQHLCFLATAVVFWWPVLTPIEESRMPALATVPYLFAAAMANTLLGIYFSFAPAGLYPLYAYPYPADTPGIISIIRNSWGLTPDKDQQLGGLLMWVVGGLAYLLFIFSIVVRWLSAADEDEGDAEQEAVSTPQIVVAASLKE